MKRCAYFPTFLSAFLPGVLVAACVLLVGCQQQSEATLTASAQRALVKGDTATAIIHLKSALQLAPDSAPVRVQLGRALLDAGDPRSAALELTKAVQAQQSPEQALPLLGEAMVADGEGQKFITQYGNEVLRDPAAMAELQAVLAGAFLAQGQFERARQTLDLAMRLAPAQTAVQLMQVRLLVREDQLPAAREQVRQLITSEPGRSDARVWRMKADLDLLAGELPERAIETYRQALSLKKNDLDARAGLVAALIQAHQPEQAAKELVALQAATPGSVRTMLLQAKLAIERGDYKAARELSQELVKRAPEVARVRELAGAVDAHAGALQQAEAHLQKALRLDPQSVIARRLLTQTYLRSGQPQQAMALLQPLLDRADPAPGVLALAAQAQLLLGDARAAETSFRQAAGQRPDDAGLRTGLAISRQAQGHTEEAAASLKSIAASDTGTTADLALIRLLSGGQQWEAALRAIDRLQAKTPADPLPALLRGQTELRRNDPQAARAAFDLALTMDKVYFPAIAELVRLDLRDASPEAARQRLNGLLQADPGHYRALLTLAELQAQTGAGAASREAVGRLVARAVASRPEQAEARVLLVNHHLAAKETKAAVVAADQAVAVLPDDVLVLDALGRSRLASGDGQQALAAFKKVVALQPQSAAPWLRMAEAHLLLQDRRAATVALQRALVLQPGSMQAQRGLILLALEAGSPQRALELVRQVQKQYPEEAVGFVLEGDVSAAQRHWSSAAVAYRQALRLASRALAEPRPSAESSPSSSQSAARGGRTSESAQMSVSVLAIKLHAALSAVDTASGGVPGPGAQSQQFAASWLTAHPRDGLFLGHLGDQAVARGDFPRAEEHYQRASTLNPLDAQALNNLAWVLARQLKPEALALAEKANRLLPDRPELMDTWALALAESGQLPRALEVQRNALALAPGNPLLKFNLAKLYLRAGDNALAKKELEQVARAGERFKDQAAVKEMLARL